MADPEVIAAWERSMRDAGSAPAPSAGDPEVPSAEVAPSGELAGEASGTNLGSAVDCGADAGVCEADGGVPVACPGCLIDGVCVGGAVINDGNPCQVCDPARDDGAWSANDGASCDDGLYCTTPDACIGTVCTGQPRECEDGVTCNGVSTCDEASGSCTAATNECGVNALCDVLSDTCVSTCEGCVIAGVCVPSGREATGNPCLVCNPALSTTTFSPAPGKTCGAAAGTCSQQDTCDGQGACQPNHLPAGSPCGSSSSSTCDQADSCDGAGRCLQRLTANGVPCDDGAFCTVADQCQGGRCISGGSRNCGANQSCNETQNRCDCSGCSVNGSCIEVGALCGANLFCAANGTCGSPAGAACSGNDDCTSNRCDTWFRDKDGDGRGDPNDTTRTCSSGSASVPPTGFVRTSTDCCDLAGASAATAALVFQGQTRFFATPQQVCDDVQPFDYNCNGSEDPDIAGISIDDFTRRCNSTFPACNFVADVSGTACGAPVFPVFCAPGQGTSTACFIGSAGISDARACR